MIVKDKFLNKLKDFGLNSYEAKLWVSLLSKGVSTAGELSDIANVPRSRSYDVLESLEKKGFIVMKIGKPIKYIAVTPGEVVERVKKRILEDAENSISIVESVRENDLMKELELMHTKGIALIDPTSMSGNIRGRDNMYNHFESMVKNAEESILIMTTPSSFAKKAEIIKKHAKKLKDKKVSVKISVPINNETIKQIREIEDFAEIRHTDEKARFAVFDGKQIYFMLVDDAKVHQNFDSAVWVNTEFFASTLENFFNFKWNYLKPHKETIRARI